jgi:hypothetical protein
MEVEIFQGDLGEQKICQYTNKYQENLLRWSRRIIKNWTGLFLMLE